MDVNAVIGEIIKISLIGLLITTGVTAFWGPKWWRWISVGSGLLLGLIVGLIINDRPFGLLTGLIIGVLISTVALFSGWFSRRYRSDRKGVDAIRMLIDPSFLYSEVYKKSQPAIAPGEKVIKHGIANHQRIISGGGGWLYLTNLRIIFKASPYNFRILGEPQYELSIPLTDILKVEPYAILYIIRRDGLKIVTTQGQSERFTVRGRNEWVKTIVDLLEKERISRLISL